MKRIDFVIKPSIILITVACLLGIAPRVAADQTVALDPQDGDTVVFLGDSITHQSLYTQYIEDFFFTRFPERTIRFHNAGVAGDSAADTLLRFDEEVAVHRPQYVTVLLGMNDGKYGNFDDQVFATFQAGMRQLLDRIEALDAKAIVLTPTMFDHGVAERRRDDPTWRFRGKPQSPDYNALMAFFGGWCLDESRRRSIETVNLWAPLNRLTQLGRRDNPNFTLVGDAIHPQASGHVVIATEILKQLGVARRFANSIVLNKQRDRWIGSDGVIDLQVDSDLRRITFANRADALPWVLPVKHATKPLRWQLPSDARLGYALTDAGHQLSADRIQVIGLPPGSYEVRIDDIAVGRFTHDELATTVELQEDERTPSYQQSLRLAQLNRQRHDDAIRPMRDKWGTIKGLRRRYADDPDTREARISEAKQVIERLQATSDALLPEIREQAKPVERSWQILRVR